MKNKIFIGALVVLFMLELALLISFLLYDADNVQDPVAVNEAVQSVRQSWKNISSHTNETALEYTVIDREENLLFKTNDGLSETVNAAIFHRDTILDIEENGVVLGKIIIYNNSVETLENARNAIAIAFGAATVIQMIICALYMFYLDCFAVKPFQKLKSFAERVAGGNLDIPLEMDRGNLFGAFTESFDIMRSELKKARLAEAKANASKKELVAKLSHDIRTPVASIKAVSELGMAIDGNEKTRESFANIIQKADHINTLVGNLFSATLEELQQLTVTPSPILSTELGGMLESADYLRKSNIADIPECVIYADKLRLQQVFDNIFANSYKYADTKINVNSFLEKNSLIIEIEDSGGGVNSEELPLLKEKFKRGENSTGIDGAGLGLYISDRFMTEMNGELLLENGGKGLKASVLISLA